MVYHNVVKLPAFGDDRNVNRLPWADLNVTKGLRSVFIDVKLTPFTSPDNSLAIYKDLELLPDYCQWMDKSTIRCLFCPSNHRSLEYMFGNVLRRPHANFTYCEVRTTQCGLSVWRRLC